jgi:hypothetical protein
MGRGVMDEFKDSDKQDKSNCIIKTELGFTSSILGCPPPTPPGPLYRWSDPRVLVSYDTNYIYVGLYCNFLIRILLPPTPFLGYNFVGFTQIWIPILWTLAGIPLSSSIQNLNLYI